MKTAARTDANQKEIVTALRKIGCYVLPTHQLKSAFDLLVAYRGKLFIMEIKDGTKPPSQRRLTPGEMKCKKDVESAGAKYWVIDSVDAAIALVTN